MGNTIITGASRGIGKAVMEKFAQEGWNIWACASHKNEEFENTIQSLSDKYHVWIKPVYFDLSDKAQISEAVREVIKEKQEIHALVNNAGINKVGLLQMTKIEDIEKIFHVNYFGMLQMTQLIAKKMMRQKNGSIINIASISGICADKGYTAYGASKAAVLYTTKVMAKEFGEYGIRVNAVAPGLIDTDMISYKSEETKQELVKHTCLKKIGMPQDVANAVFYFASADSAYVTGSTLIVDGGSSI